MRICQIIYFYSFFEGISIELRLFCQGFGWANFSFLFNVFTYLIPSNYFEKGSYGFSLTVKYPNFLLNGGYSIFYVTLITLIFIIIIIVDKCIVLK